VQGGGAHRQAGKCILPRLSPKRLQQEGGRRGQ